MRSTAWYIGPDGPYAFTGSTFEHDAELAKPKTRGPFPEKPVAKLLGDSYVRQMERQPIHVSYRHDVEFREYGQTHSWNMHTRGRRQLNREASWEEANKLAVELQRARPDRTFRVIERCETETRCEPFHPDMFRREAFKL